MVHGQSWVPALPPARRLPSSHWRFPCKSSLIQLSLQKIKQDLMTANLLKLKNQVLLRECWHLLF